MIRNLFYINKVIIPDIHGRTFWKQIITKFPKHEYPHIKFIFLGDYLYPYIGYEDITREDAINNFKDILDYANNDDRVVLLLGNHDLHYLLNVSYSRKDIQNRQLIKNMFRENIHLFKLTYTCVINKRQYIFSHAGITNNWLDYIINIFNTYKNKKRLLTQAELTFIDKIQNIKNTKNFNIFNQSLLYLKEDITNNNILTFISYLDTVSLYRGGYHRFGSLIWADVNEHINDCIPNFFVQNNIYQIFGHTINYPNSQFSYEINDNWAMLDASQLFAIYDDGYILPFNEIIYK